MTLLPIDEQYFTSHQVTKSLCSIRSFDKLIKEKSIINISYFKIRMTNYLCISQKERKLYRHNCLLGIIFLIMIRIQKTKQTLNP
jgi:hypothetical protein